MGECLAKIGSQLELGSGVNGGGEEEEDEAERRERNHRGGLAGSRERKGGVTRAMTKIPLLTLLFVPSSGIFDTVRLLHNPN